MEWQEFFLEIANEKKADVEIETVPGVTAASAAASVLVRH